jgi:hypothetical protein
MAVVVGERNQNVERGRRKRQEVIDVVVTHTPSIFTTDTVSTLQGYARLCHGKHAFDTNGGLVCHRGLGASGE